MSTRVATLQARRTGGSILLAAFLASLVMLTIAVVAVSVDQGRPGETSFVGRQLVNTPSELNAGIVGGAEQTFGYRGDPAAVRQAYVEPVYMHGRNLRGLSPLTELGTNTPTELSGGIIGGLPAKVYARHQRR